LTTGLAEPVGTARSFLIDPFGDNLESVAKELGVDPSLVEGQVAMTLCPPVHRSVDGSNPLLLGEISRLTRETRNGLSRAADSGTLNPNISALLSRRAGLDAVVAVALGHRSIQHPIPDVVVPYRPNALLVAAVYIEDIARWACAELNRMLYGQLAPIGADPFTSRLGDGFGLEIAHSLALGGCAGTHDDANCTRRRHNIRQWNPSVEGEPPSLFYWLFNLLVGARASARRESHHIQINDGDLMPRGARLQAGALRESVLPHRLNLGVHKALLLRCRDCDRKLDGVSVACLGKARSTNEQCDVYVQFDDKRLLVNPIATHPAPIRCQLCSGAVDQTGLDCPGCGEVVTNTRPSPKTYIPEDVTHPLLRFFACDIDHSDSEDAVVAALCRSLSRHQTNVSQSVRLVADELDLDLQDVIEIAGRHTAVLRTCLMEAEE